MSVGVSTCQKVSVVSYPVTHSSRESVTQRLCLCFTCSFCLSWLEKYSKFTMSFFQIFGCLHYFSCLWQKCLRDAAGNYPTRATGPMTWPILNRDNYPYYPWLGKDAFPNRISWLSSTPTIQIYLGMIGLTLLLCNHRCTLVLLIHQTKQDSLAWLIPWKRPISKY